VLLQKTEVHCGVRVKTQQPANRATHVDNEVQPEIDRVGLNIPLHTLEVILETICSRDQ